MTIGEVGDMKKLFLSLIAILVWLMPNISSAANISPVVTDNHYHIAVFKQWPKKATGATLTFIDPTSPSKTKSVKFVAENLNEQGMLEIDSVSETTVVKIEFKGSTSYCTVNAETETDRNECTIN